MQGKPVWPHRWDNKEKKQIRRDAWEIRAFKNVANRKVGGKTTGGGDSPFERLELKKRKRERGGNSDCPSDIFRNSEEGGKWMRGELTRTKGGNLSYTSYERRKSFGRGGNRERYRQVA